jgi:hypothetical protein
MTRICLHEVLNQLTLLTPESMKRRSRQLGDLHAKRFITIIRGCYWLSGGIILRPHASSEWVRDKDPVWSSFLLLEQGDPSVWGRFEQIHRG